MGGKTEWADAKETGPPRLAFVGWQMDHQEILAQPAECLVNEPS